MADFDVQVQWCDTVAKLLKSHKKVANLDIPTVVKEVQTLLVQIKDVHAKNPTLAKSRVVTEYTSYERRFVLLSARAEQIRLDQKNKKIKEKEAAVQMAQVGQELINVRNAIHLGLSEIDSTVANKPEVKELRREAEKHRPVYENKRERIQDAIEELRAMLPGPESQISALIDLYDKGVALEPDYEAAYKKLVGLSKLYTEGINAAGNFDKSLGNKDYLKSMAAAEKAIGAFEAEFAVGHSDQVELQRQALMDQRKAVQKAGKNPTAVTSAIAEINKVAKSAGDLLTEYRSKGETAAGELKLRWADIEELELCAPVEVLAGVLQDYDSARSLLGSQQYVPAQEALSGLKDKLEPLLTTHRGHKKAWDELLAKGAAAQLNTVASLRSGEVEQSSPEASAAAWTLYRAGEAAKQLAVANNFKAAVDRMTPLLEGLKALAAWDGKATFDLSALKDEATKFLCQLDGLEKLVFAAWGRVTTRAGDLASKGLDLSTLPGPVETARSDCQRLEFEWRAKIRGERSFAEAGKGETPEQHSKRLPATIATLRKDLKTELLDEIDKLLAEMLKLEPSPEAVKKHKQDEQALAENKKWARTQASYLRQLQALADSVAPGSPVALEVARLRAVLQDLPVKASEAQAFELKDPAQRKQLRDQADLAVKTVIAPKIIELEKQASEALATQRSAKPELVKQAEKLLKKLSEELKPKKPPKGEAKEVWQEYAETLRLELTAAITMVDTDNMSVVESGMADLRALVNKVTDLLKDAPTGGKSAIKGGFEAVQAARKALELKLTTQVPDEADKYLPNEVAQLLGEFRMSLPDQLKGASPEEATQAVKALETKLEETRKKAVALAKTRSELMAAQGKEVSDAVDLLETTHADSVKALVADLRRKLAAVDTPQAQYTSGQLVLRDLLLTIKAANTSEDARNQLENKSAQTELSSEQDSELAPQRYESARDVFTKDLYRQVKALKKESGSAANNALFQEIAQHLGAAKKSATAGAKFLKSGDRDAGNGQYAAANNSLRLATEVAEAFIRNPLSATAASNKALGEADQRWKIAVGTYVEQVRGLKDLLLNSINGYASTTPDPVADGKRKEAWMRAAVQSMDKLPTLLDGTAFSTTVKILSTPIPKDPSELALRRRNKETALARLSQFERELNGNPVLNLTRSHPSSPVTLTKLLAALGGLRSAIVTS